MKTEKIDRTQDTEFYVENPYGKKPRAPNRRSSLYEESLQNAGNTMSVSTLPVLLTRCIYRK
jgi:hypothetical protein